MNSITGNTNDDFPEWHIWDLKKATAEFLIPRLQKFKDWFEAGKMVARPVWVTEEFELDKEDDDALIKAWVFIIGEMIYSFKVNAGLIVSSNRAEDERVERGLYYFYKYYGHLWD